MDPKACLDRVESAIEDRDWIEAREALADYRQWRSRGGFEPENGDARESALRARLPGRVTRPAGWHVTGTGGGCTAWQRDLPDGRYALITDGNQGAPSYDSEDLVIALYPHPDADDSDEIAGPHYGNLASCLAWFDANRDKGASIDLSAYRLAVGSLRAFTSIGSYTLAYQGPKGEIYCAGCAAKRQIAHVGAHMEGAPLHCAQCSHTIHSAYGPPKE